MASSAMASSAMASSAAVFSACVAMLASRAPSEPLFVDLCLSIRGRPVSM
jgi:hypothetical protein